MRVKTKQDYIRRCWLNFDYNNRWLLNREPKWPKGSLYSIWKGLKVPFPSGGHATPRWLASYNSQSKDYRKS